MKISKVNHTRTGVSIKNSESGGIIYATPKQPDAKVNIKEHIRGLNEKSKGLYSPFNSNTIVCEPYISVSKKDYEKYKKSLREIREAEKQIKLSCKSFIVGLAKEDLYSIDKFENSLKGQVIDNVYDFVNERFCKAIVNECLRKSLKKTVKEKDKKVQYSIKDIMLRVIMTIADISFENSKYGFS